MKKTTAALAVAAMALTACGSAPPPEDPAAKAAAEAGAAALAQDSLEERNKQVVLQFFKPGITPDQMYELMHPDYVQHNPVFKRFGEINGLKGREEFKALAGFFFPAGGDAPPPPPARAAGAPADDPTYLVVAEGDTVTVLQKRYQPDPLKPGEFYETFWYDTWRLKDGKLYEHWDPATIDAKNIPPFLKGPLAGQPK